MGKPVKIDYKKIELAVKRMALASQEVRRVASLRVGMISGGPGIEEENAEATTAYNELLVLVVGALESGAMESRLMVAIEDAPGRIIEIARNHYDGIRFNREYDDMSRKGLI
jgi:hypothetical protein